MAAPSKLPEWATVPTPGDLVEPAQPQKDLGWHLVSGVPQKPAYQHFNWWQNLVHQWVSWFSFLTTEKTGPYILTDSQMPVNVNGDASNATPVTIYGDLIVRGNLTLGATLTVFGDLYVTGNVTGNFALDVRGDTRVVGNLNLSGVDSATAPTAGAPLTCERNAYIGGYLWTKGGAGTAAGIAGANAGSVSVAGDCVAGDGINARGGGAVEANTGSGGNISVGKDLQIGNASNDAEPMLTTAGGDLAGAGSGSFATGAGGNINVSGSLCVSYESNVVITVLQAIWTRGGGVSSGTVTTLTAGDAGNIFVGKNLSAFVKYDNTYKKLHIYAYGQIAVGAGTSGKGGSVTVGGNVFCGDLFTYSRGLSTATAKAGGDIYIGGNLVCSKISTVSGADLSGIAITTLIRAVGGSLTVQGAIAASDAIIVSGSTNGKVDIKGNVWSGAISVDALTPGQNCQTVEIGGNLYCGGNFNTSTAANTGGIAGNTAPITIQGNALFGGVLFCTAGDGASGGGGANKVIVRGNTIISGQFTMSGGNSTGSNNGGYSDGFLVNGNMVVFGVMTLRSGNGGLTGNGGGFGSIEVSGNLRTGNLTLTVGAGGASGAGGVEPSFFVRGNIAGGIWSFTGGAGGSTSGNGGNAPSFVALGNVLLTSFTGTGGNTATGTGGSGGGFSASNADVPTVSLTGGTATGAAGIGGAAGGVAVRGSFRCSTYSCNGGNSTSASGGAGGGGGSLLVNHMSHETTPPTILLKGGNTSGSSQGGASGTVNIFGSGRIHTLTCTSGNGVSFCGTIGSVRLADVSGNSIIITEGSGPTVGSAQSLELSGTIVMATAIQCPTFALFVIKPQFSNKGVILRTSALIGKTTLQNPNGTNTADQAANAGNSIYTTTSTIWARAVLAVA
jgi:hypothetical protein